MSSFYISKNVEVGNFSELTRWTISSPSGGRGWRGEGRHGGGRRPRAVAGGDKYKLRYSAAAPPQPPPPARTTDTPSKTNFVL